MAVLAADEQDAVFREVLERLGLDPMAKGLVIVTWTEAGARYAGMFVADRVVDHIAEAVGAVAKVRMEPAEAGWRVTAVAAVGELSATAEATGATQPVALVAARRTAVLGLFDVPVRLLEHCLGMDPPEPETVRAAVVGSPRLASRGRLAADGRATGLSETRSHRGDAASPADLTDRGWSQRSEGVRAQSPLDEAASEYQLTYLLELLRARPYLGCFDSAGTVVPHRVDEVVGDLTGIGERVRPQNLSSRDMNTLLRTLGSTYPVQDPLETALPARAPRRPNRHFGRAHDAFWGE